MGVMRDIENRGSFLFLGVYGIMREGVERFGRRINKVIFFILSFILGVYLFWIVFFVGLVDI